MDWEKVQTKQPQAATILTNALRKDQLAHAYLFIGRRGTGKKESALHLAHSFFCSRVIDVEPCGECPDCRRIDSGNHPDLVTVKPDGRTIKKQQVADLIKAFTYRGVESDKKFFIIEQADQMTAQAANSLLKFIEEPESATIAVLLAENRHLLLDTILSRCQIIPFKTPPIGEIEKRLTQEGVAPILAKTALAITQDIEEATALCEDEWFVKARGIVIHFMEDLFIRPNHVIITVYEQFSTHFNDIGKAQIGLDLITVWLRDLLSTHLDKLNEIVFADQVDHLKQYMMKASIDWTARALSMVLDAKKRLNVNSQPLMVMEQLVFRLQEGAESHV